MVILYVTNLEGESRFGMDFCWTLWSQTTWFGWFQLLWEFRGPKTNTAHFQLVTNEEGISEKMNLANSEKKTWTNC